MKIKISIETSTPAFDTEDDNYSNAEGEVARILRQLADKWETFGIDDTPLYDIDGNKVGEAVS